MGPCNSFIQPLGIEQFNALRLCFMYHVHVIYFLNVSFFTGLHKISLKLASGHRAQEPKQSHLDILPVLYRLALATRSISSFFLIA
jgi:hypothetical protein